MSISGALKKRAAINSCSKPAEAGAHIACDSVKLSPVRQIYGLQIYI